MTRPTSRDFSESITSEGISSYLRIEGCLGVLDVEIIDESFDDPLPSLEPEVGVVGRYRRASSSTPALLEGIRRWICG